MKFYFVTLRYPTGQMVSWNAERQEWVDYLLDATAYTTVEDANVVLLMGEDLPFDLFILEMPVEFFFKNEREL